MKDDKWIEELYKYAESNIVGYKRPADYKERIERILNGNRRPAHTNINHPEHRGEAS